MPQNYHDLAQRLKDGEVYSEKVRVPGVFGGAYECPGLGTELEKLQTSSHQSRFLDIDTWAIEDKPK